MLPGDVVAPELPGPLVGQGLEEGCIFSLVGDSWTEYNFMFYLQRETSSLIPSHESPAGESVVRWVTLLQAVEPSLLEAGKREIREAA